MDTKPIIKLLEERKYQEALALFAKKFQSLTETKKLSAIRGFMNQPEERIRDLLNIMDAALMGQWSRILVRCSHRRLKSPNTLIWYCGELIDENKVIEAEELLKKLEEEALPAQTAEKLYFHLADLLIQMRRFKEARMYMEKCEKATNDSMNTRWAYYLLHKGEWEKALGLLEKGKKDKKEERLRIRL
jgi:tetratricopeptide (TPR) repeat protein